MTRTTLALLFSAVALAAPAAATNLIPGNLVVSVEGNGVWGAASGGYTDNQAAPLTLMQFSHEGTSNASYVSSIVLPQSGSGAISGEYGSSSEGGLQLTSDGKHLVIMGYGVKASDFNANPTAYGTLTTDPTKPTALGQSGSMTNAGYQAVARVVAVIDGDGSVDTSTQLYNVFNGNNPRSVASKDGKTFYVSGQGVDGDQTAGVFYATKGASSATSITGDDTATVKNGPRNATQDTRVVEFGPNGELLVSVDSKDGKDNARSFIGALGTDPTTLYNNGSGPTQLSGYGNSGGTGKVTLTAQTANGISTAGQEINLSPESFFFADPNTLYVADSGAPKQDSAKKTTGDGGLQKWIFDGTNWNLVYTISAGLNLVSNSSAHGTTGLLGLTGQVVDGQVQLFATNYTAGDTDQTYLFGLSDLLSATTKQSGEAFSILAAAPADSNFKGVSFAPSATASVPEPMTYASMILGFALIGGTIRRRQRTEAAAIA
ncbi:MAG TPA: PEPxxWA-CTERM sorting domain-containing protein [Sphingomonas sp.]|nr:PEPxxWA-CTERM sorting domain-containing protein [Sphingomonas sp.]HMI20681.1 PEPxxWA-CTERM sorting domain-containing protein [Sphingomonas sp.]